MLEYIEKATQSLLGWLFITIAGGFLWIIRRVFTNQKQIELLQRDIEAREQLRQRDREDLQEVKSDVKDLAHDIKRLFQQHADR